MLLQSIWIIAQIQMRHAIQRSIYNVTRPIRQMYACVRVGAFGMIRLVVNFLGKLMFSFDPVFKPLLFCYKVIFETSGQMCTSVIQCNATLGLTCDSGYCS